MELKALATESLNLSSTSEAVSLAAGLESWGVEKPSALDKINVLRLLSVIRRDIEKRHQEPVDELTLDALYLSTIRYLNQLYVDGVIYDYIVDIIGLDCTDKTKLTIDVSIKPIKTFNFVHFPIEVR